MSVKSNSNVPECCGLVNIGQNLAVLRQRSPQKSLILTSLTAKITSWTDEVVSAWSKKVKE